MKNLFGQKEFKQLKEIQMITESMDFSNKVGWSDCLIGRAVNKLFSFVAKSTYMIVLKRLQNKLGDEYLKAAFLAMSKSGIEIKEGKNAIAIASIASQNKNDKKELQPNVNAESDKNNILIFEIPANSELKDWRTLIKPLENSTWEINKEKNKQLEELTEEFSIVVIAENGTTTQTYTVQIINEGKEIPALPAPIEEPKTEPKAIEYKKYEILQKVSFTKQIEQVQKFVDEFDKECVKGQEYAIMMRLSKHLKTESEKISQIMKHVETATEPSEGLQKYVDNKEEYNNFVKKLQELSDTIKNKSNEIQDEKRKDISDEEMKTLIDNAGKEKTTEIKAIKLEDVDKYLDEITKLKQHIQSDFDKSPNKHKMDEREKDGTSLSEKINNLYDLVTKAFNKKLGKKYTDEQRYEYYINFKNIIKQTEEVIKESHLENFSNLLVEKLSKKYDSLIETINSYEKYEKLYEETIKNVMRDLKKTTGKTKEDYKEVNTKYGDINVNKIQPEEMMKNFSEKPELRQLATSLVDKEALKELALRAEWLYGGDKYVDERNKHYSRVNMTITHTDQAKIENTWKRMIANTKSQYSAFFVDKNGNFPGELDPIALIKSDKAFREAFRQYEKDPRDPSKDPSLFSSDEINQPVPSELAKLYLVNKKIDDGQFGIIGFKTTDGKFNLGVVVSKSTLGEKTPETLHVWKFVGMYNLNEILKKIANVSDKEAIKKVIKENNYSGSKKYRVNIKDPILLKQFDLLYKTFRPSENPLFIENKKFVNKQDQLSTFFIMKSNLETPQPKHFLHLDIVKKTDATLHSYISIPDKDKLKINEFIDIDNDTTFANLENKDVKSISLKLIITGIYQMYPTAKGFWEVAMDDARESEKTKFLTENTKILDKIKKLYYPQSKSKP